MKSEISKNLPFVLDDERLEPLVERRNAAGLLELGQQPLALIRTFDMWCIISEAPSSKHVAKTFAPENSPTILIALITVKNRFPTNAIILATFSSKRP